MTASRLLAIIACVMGAAGVVAAAAAGHGGGESRLAAAAQMLLVHAAASLALATAAHRTRLLTMAAAAMQGGAILFATDMVLRATQGRALFAFAAPLGGTTLILAWVGAALAFWLLPSDRHSNSDWAG